MAKPDPPEDDDPALNPRWALIIAAGVLVIIRSLVPYGDQILYPFTLFATWIHEMGHGITGLMLGGTFTKLEIFLNGSGLAHGAVSPGWPEAARAAGGLIAPPLFGAVILATARGPKRSTIVLWTIAGVLALTIPIWVRSATGFIALPLVAMFVALVALRADPDIRQILAQLLGLFMGLDTITRIDYLFSSTAKIQGEELPSDVAIIADAVGGHYLFWGGLLAGLSLVLLVIGLRLSWAAPMQLKNPFKRKKTADET